MKNFSKKNTYSTSSGERLNRNQIEDRIRKAKKEKIDSFIIENDYVFCEECGVSSGTYFDCSHIVSVKECLESGRAELSWDINNIRLLCRQHHREHDKTN